MNSLFSGFSIDGHQSIRYIEWMLIVLGLLLGFIDGSYEYSFTITLQGIGLYAALALLNCINPFDRPRWERRVYVFLNMLLVTSPVWTGVVMGLLLFLAIIKSCFLLEFKDVVFTLISAGIAYMLASIWYLPEVYEVIQQRGVDWFLTPQRLIFSNLSFFLGTSIFAVLLSLVILAERNSRCRAEALANEVEILAANLERTRIAREIHDSLGHTLTSLGVQLEVAQKLRDRDLNKAFQSVDNAALLANQCLQEIRQTVHAIRESTFDLNTALYELARQMQPSIVVQTHLQLPPLSLQTSHHLYCIFKEGLLNVQKHAQASYATLNGQAIDDTLTLELVDNGCGFDLTQPSDGFGLKGMAERVELLEGTLTIKSAPDQGTHLRVVIPR